MKTVTLPVVVLLALASSANAGELRYQPVNPTFGGNPLNGPFLIATANANNYDHLVNPNAVNALSGVNPSTPTTAQLLQQALTANLISQASNQALNTILSGNGPSSGTFNIAGTTIAFNRVGGQINITLTDPSGGTTQISVPVTQF